MKSNNVVSLDHYRGQREIAQRMAQNSLILHAAIKDDRLTRDDLKLLDHLLNWSIICGQLRLKYDPHNRPLVRSITKLQRAGYLNEPEVLDLDVGFRSPGPRPFWVFTLTERELDRDWR